MKRNLDRLLQKKSFRIPKFKVNPEIDKLRRSTMEIGFLILIGIIWIACAFRHSTKIKEEEKIKDVDDLEAKSDISRLIKALKYREYYDYTFDEYQNIDNAGLVDKCTDIRKKAAKALGKFSDARAVEPLIDALGDKFSWVRKAAAEVLGKIGDPRAVKPLAALLLDEDGDVREVARNSLKKFGSPAIEHFITLMKDKNWRVREASAIELGRMRYTGAVTCLISALQDEATHVRCAAAYALGEIGDPKAKKYLEALLNDKHEDVRRIANSALKEFR